MHRCPSLVRSTVVSMSVSPATNWLMSHQRSTIAGIGSSLTLTDSPLKSCISCSMQFYQSPQLFPNRQFFFCSSRACKQTAPSISNCWTSQCLWGDVFGCKRKIFFNKSQLCHFLTLAYILFYYKGSINQEMCLINLAMSRTSLALQDESWKVKNLHGLNEHTSFLLWNLVQEWLSSNIMWTGDILYSK